MGERSYIIAQLRSNQAVIEHLLRNASEEEVVWRSHAKHWCLLEVICHLYDEERDDFRARLDSVLKDPSLPLPRSTPLAWVSERKYMEQDFGAKLDAFLAERDSSLAWLQSLADANWDHAYQHPEVGPLPAHMFLTNWLAHDYLHIRQIVRVKYQYLGEWSGDSLAYAGTW
jgi:hypothetical protein